MPFDRSEVVCGFMGARLEEANPHKQKRNKSRLKQGSYPCDCVGLIHTLTNIVQTFHSIPLISENS